MPIGEKLLQRIRENDKDLHLLNFEEEINEEDLEKLIGALQFNTIVCSIKILNNTFKEKGLICLASFFKQSQTVISLSLMLNCADEAGIKSLAAALEKKNIKTLEFYGANTDNKNCLLYLIEAMRLNRGIQVIDLYLPTPIAKEKFTPWVLKTDTSFPAIALEWYERKDLISLAEIIKSYRSLHLVGIEWCSKNVGLKLLREIFKFNSSFSSLSFTMIFSNNQNAKYLAEVLQTPNLNLDFLNLAGNRVNNLGFGYIIQAIKFNTSIASLDLSNNIIKTEGLKRFTRELKANNLSLTAINLTNNHFDPQGLKSLAHALVTNTVLRVLNLTGNKIEKTATGWFAQALMVNTVLQELMLDYNKIDTQGFSEISQMLKVNTTLTYLSFQGSVLNVIGVRYLVDGLKSNTSLKTLMLWGYGTTTAGASLFLASLHAINLTSVGFGRMNLTDNPEIIKNLARALRSNDKIKTIYFYPAIGNNIKILRNELRSNTTLTELKLQREHNTSPRLMPFFKPATAENEGDRLTVEYKNI